MLLRMYPKTALMTDRGVAMEFTIQALQSWILALTMASAAYA